MNIPPHRIRTLRLRIHTETTPQGFDLRTQFRREWADMVLPIMEKECDALCPDTQVIHIPKMEVTVRVDSPETLAKQLPHLLQRPFQDQLHALTSDTSSFSKSKMPAISSPDAHTSFNILCQYLETGTLPWQLGNQPINAIAQHLQKSAHDALPQLMSFLIPSNISPNLLFRLFQLFSQDQWDILLNSLVGYIPRSWQPLVKELDSLWSSKLGGEEAHLTLRCGLNWLVELLTTREESGIPNPRDTIQRVLGSPQHGHFRHILSHFPECAAEESQSSFISREITTGDEPKTAPPDTPEHWPSRPFSTEPASFPNQPSPHEGALMKLPSSSLRPDQEKPPPVLLNQDLYPLMVPHAGLILLHPFLTQLFRATAITSREDPFVPGLLLPRAAALLHYLATGEEHPFEFELGFIKIFLGLTPESPLHVIEGLLLPSDKTEAHTLLQSVITHWTALKNISLSTLRTSFLQRQGLIRKDDQGWKLHLEPQPYDMLLHRLPWSISVVRPPWMTQAIYTEWEHS